MQKYRDTNEMELKIDIRTMIKDVLRYSWLIVIMAISFSLIAYMIIDSSYKPKYTSSTTFIVTGKGLNNSIYDNLLTAQDMTNRFKNIIDSNILKEKIAEVLSMDSFDAEAEAEIVPETNLMVLRVTADTSKKAFQILQAIMENYTVVSDYVVSNVILEVLEEPQIPMAASNANQAEDIAKKAFWISGAAVLALILFFSMKKDTIKSEQDFRKKLDIRYLGTIYHERKHKTILSAIKREPVSVLVTNPILSRKYVNSVEMTAAKVRNRMDSKRIKTVMVTSMMENEGKSTVIANLALEFSKMGKKVLLIDLDLRKPSQHAIFNRKGESFTGIAEWLKNKTDPEEKMVQIHNSNLFVLFNSQTFRNSLELMDYLSWKNWIKKMEQKMDYILIDTSPVALVSDGESLAHIIENTILVVRYDTMLAADLNDVTDTLNEAGSKVIGGIFNNAYSDLLERIGMEQYGRKTSY